LACSAAALFWTILGVSQISNRPKTSRPRKLRKFFRNHSSQRLGWLCLSALRWFYLWDVRLTYRHRFQAG
jgi:hypothetical protein